MLSQDRPDQMPSSVDRGSRPDPTPPRLVSVPHNPRAAGLTYEPFYGLREKPFSLTADSRFFYQSRAHAPAFDELLGAIRRRESLNVLTGDTGTGKTTLCRAVLSSLDRKTFSAFVPDPFASREDLLKILLIDFGVVSVDDVASGRLRGATRTDLSYLLYEFLGTLVPLQAFAVVVIDEAQNLSLPLLEEVRILSDAEGQLQVVLVGQLEFRQRLKLPAMRQLDQRVSVHCELSPLDLAGVAGYISHRLQQAGGSPDRIRFSDDAVEAIFEESGGVPRLVNRVCDRALHHAYNSRASTIDRAIVEAAKGQAPVRVAPPPPAADVSTPSAPDAPSEQAAPAAAAAPAPVVEAPPRAEEPSAEEKIEQWVTRADAQVDAPPPPRPLLTDWRRRWLPTNVAIDPDDRRRSALAQTKVERQARRAQRRLAGAVIGLLAVAGVLIIASFSIGASVDLWSAVSARFAPPPSPDLPPPVRPKLPPPAVAPAPPPLDAPR